MRLQVRLLALAVCGMTLLQGETWEEMKEACKDTKKGFFSRIGGCFADAFQLSDVPKLIVHSFPPPGSIGFGIWYSKEFPMDKWERHFETGAAVSIRGFWYAGAKVSFAHITSSGTDEQLEFRLYGNYIDRKRVSFYGLGPMTHRSDLTDFREKLGTIGGDVSKPLNNYYTVGAVLEGLIPSVEGTSGSIPSIEKKFTDVTAPGLAEQPPMVRLGGFLRFHHDSPRYRQKYEDKVSYDLYQTAGGGYYSFRRFQVDVHHDFYLLSTRRGRERRDSVLTIHGLLSSSDAGSGNRVPFYLQQTLGGQNENGEAMLRGFDDYRFRGTHLALIQTEYAHRLWASRPGQGKTGACTAAHPCSALRSASLTEGILHTLGIFGFYDVGQVAMQRGDLDMGRMRHSVGGGLAIFVGGVLEARFFVGLGGGEGHHTFSVLPKF